MFDGSGLFIDDIHVWKVSLNVVPVVTNLQVETLDAQVFVSWDMPPYASYDNDEISYTDGTFEDAIGLSPTSTGTAVMGNEFEMPYGVESFVANSCAIWGYPGASGETTLKAFSFLAGTPGSQPDYTLNVTLQKTSGMFLI